MSAFTPVLNSKGTVSVGVIDLFQDSIAIKVGGQSTTNNTCFGLAVFEKYTADQIGSITGLLGPGFARKLHGHELQLESEFRIFRFHDSAAHSDSHCYRSRRRSID